MKAVCILTSLICLSNYISAQSIQFNSIQYHQGDNVIAELSVTSGKTITGYGNDLDNASHAAPPNPQNINLGNVPDAGVYNISFSFNDGSVEVYSLIVCANASSNIPSGSVVLVKSNVEDVTSFNDFYKKFSDGFNQLDFKEILTETGKEYLTSHAISGSATIAICIASAVVPVVEGGCVTGLENNTIEFGKILIKRIIFEMKNKGLIDETQKQNYLAIFSTATGIVDILSGTEDKVWDQIITATSATADVILTDGSELNAAIQQSNQFYDQTKFVIKFIKN